MSKVLDEVEAILDQPMSDEKVGGGSQVGDENTRDKFWKRVDNPQPKRGFSPSGEQNVFIGKIDDYAGRRLSEEPRKDEGGDESKG